MRGITIVSTGSYLPEDCIPNEAFVKYVDTSDEWIRTRTGIQSRHIANGEPTWYMGAQAGKKALESGGVAVEDVDLILVSCCTPDYMTPSMACMIQRELGAVNAMCIDLNSACSGFVHGLDTARRYLAADEDVKTVLLVSTERLSQMVDFTDRSVCVLLGDGAGACVVRRKEDALYAFTGGADGVSGGALNVKYPRHESPFGDPEKRKAYFEFPEVREKFLYMDGREVYRFSTRVFPEMVKTCCEKLGISVEQLDHVVPHQANYRIVDTGLKNLPGLDREKVFLNLEKYGNTGSASIAIALDEMNGKGMLRRGDKVAVMGFGGGLTYAGIVFEW